MNTIISGTMITEDDMSEFENTGYNLIEESKKADFKI